MVGFYDDSGPEQGISRSTERVTTAKDDTSAIAQMVRTNNYSFIMRRKTLSIRRFSTPVENV